MYEVHTEITVKNGNDVAAVGLGYRKEAEVRQVTVDSVVDTCCLPPANSLGVCARHKLHGPWTLVINEETRLKLGLETRGKDFVNMADGTSSPGSLVGPVEVWWKDRMSICKAIVLAQGKEILLGAIPMEDMDITVDLRASEVVGAHGDQIVHRVY